MELNAPMAGQQVPPVQNHLQIDSSSLAGVLNQSPDVVGQVR